MAAFSLCTKDCVTCSQIVPTTTFVSAANGFQFDGLYQFGDHETKTLSCRTVNCIYMLECRNCLSQYVGETVQELRDRMGQHRRSTKSKGDSGNFRIRQHYACSGGKCITFKIYIIQKLPGTGRTCELQPNSSKFKIDQNITQVRKGCEDNWVRSLHSQFPYGCNDRIDSFKEKWRYNCEYAKFISPKPKRRRSWRKSNGDDVDQPNTRLIVDRLLSILRADFHSSYILELKRLLFPLPQKHLACIRELYLKEVFTDNILKHQALYRQSHFIITDLLAYKIEPFNSAINANSNKPKKNRILFKLLFVNRALDMINLPYIFRNKELKSYVNFCSIREPSVLFSNKPSIGSKLFNYNQTVNDFTCLEDVTCVCHDFTDFINNDCGHVATGDVDIFSNSKLRDILNKGPKHREPVTLNFEEARKSILGNLDSFIKSWADKEHFDKSCFDGWRVKFEELLETNISNLKEKYRNPRIKCSIFDDPEVKEELNYFHEHFVLCPVDKAAKNIAIVCKQFYLKTLLDECMNNSLSYCSINDTSIDDICGELKDFMKRADIDITQIDNRLPHIVLFPKFHKPKLSQRFVVSYASCSVKPLAARLTLALKAVYKKIISYSNMIFKVTGVNRNWIIDNNTSLLDCLNNTEFARNIQTYDFTTLYTNLDHSNIKVALTSVIKLAFKHAKCKCISVYDKSFAWVNKPRDTTFYFDENSLIDAVNFLIDNCYFTLGNLVFRQIIGVPIGVDPGPYIANLTLWYYENSYLEKLYKYDFYGARMMGKTFRLIDDITSINSDGVFGQHVGNIYPSSLTLNKENVDDSYANVLDLNVKIIEGKFNVTVYDKRDDFPFQIVQFSGKDSNIPRSTTLGIFQSQLLRFFRICSNLEGFTERLRNIFFKFLDLGFDRELLKSRFVCVAEKHNFIGKFNNIDELYTVFD